MPNRSITAYRADGGLIFHCNPFHKDKMNFEITSLFIQILRKILSVIESRMYLLSYLTYQLQCEKLAAT